MDSISGRDLLCPEDNGGAAGTLCGKEGNSLCGQDGGARESQGQVCVRASFSEGRDKHGRRKGQIPSGDRFVNKINIVHKCLSHGWVIWGWE